ncbi:GNAT family acetyltransferase, putative [Talaromyces stipitatus ATCC 10500]|uniref:GNAT family acetyltransferase, putative n=1 Tax=Talaromyces stipitatus (strain ATCC 10500 / CBS 375.48 / QM 6759 / NRRL 1006) TaxID=441959 RepID=B8LZ07_TALSN|nr:GNAT family acetyltransferase, putative [Talaromyces stipitatus ATCC 10500]EED23515.1 GNAT family acetyltransferase, putative [Talaromyces stipitatus ATCC 10500]
MPGSVLENTTDPPLPPPKHHLQSAPLLTPIQATLPNTLTNITLYPTSNGPTSLPQELITFLHEEFSVEILKGCTYPMEEPMSFDRFREYWFGTFAVVVLKGTVDESRKLLQGDGKGVDWKEVCLGTFYIKPNYPGRCSHICNAGFLTCSHARGQGIGSIMGRTYLEYAPKLGYKYSVFNLVFANNPASSKIWDRLGFEVLGRVPGAGRLANSEELVDALIYGRSLV